MDPGSPDSFEIGGREIALPVCVRDGDQWSVQYLVETDLGPYDEL